MSETAADGCVRGSNRQNGWKKKNEGTQIMQAFACEGSCLVERCHQLSCLLWLVAETWFREERCSNWEWRWGEIDTHKDRQTGKERGGRDTDIEAEWKTLSCIINNKKLKYSKIEKERKIELFIDRVTNRQTYINIQTDRLKGGQEERQDVCYVMSRYVMLRYMVIYIAPLTGRWFSVTGNE